MRSSVKTPPAVRKSWSAASAASAASSDAGTCGHQGQLLGRQVVEVLVDRVGRLDLVQHAVEAGQQHRREGQVGVASEASGQRNSTRLALGLRWASGMRHDADRLRWL